MKTVFYRHSLLSRGGDKMIVEHANFLARSGHEVLIKTALIDTIFAIDASVNVEVIPGKRKLVTLLSAVLTKFDADVVVADIIPLACFLWPRNRGRVLFFAQDYHESYYTNIFQKLIVRGFYYLGLSFLKIPTVVVAEHLKVTFLKRYGFESIVVENGVDQESFFPDIDPQLINEKGGRKSILVLARADWRKGYDLAREIIQRVKTSTSIQFEVWTVGASAEDDFAGLLHRDFGYVDKVRMRRLMSSADLFLYPTRDEGFGLMPLEAMACGCPVVASEAIDFMRREQCGWVNPVDGVESFVRSVVEAMSTPEVTAKRAQVAMAIARTKSLKNCCEKFADTINALYK